MLFNKGAFMSLRQPSMHNSVHQPRKSKDLQRSVPLGGLTQPGVLKYLANGRPVPRAKRKHRPNEALDFLRERQALPREQGEADFAREDEAQRLGICPALKGLLPSQHLIQQHS